MNEVWQKIKDYEDVYKLSNLGRVYSYHCNRCLSLETNNHGYVFVTLWKNNKRKRFKIHRLIGEYFLDNTENYPEINHIDGDKSNNSVYNLEWCSRSMNMKHSYDINLRKLPKGSLNPNSKLNENDIKKIINLLNKNTPVKDIANNYNVTWECVNNIKLNKSWKHVCRLI